MPSTLDRNQTLGELVARQPAAAPVLEHYQMDYCCGGSTKIEAACSSAGITVEQLSREIAAAAPVNGTTATDWTQAALPDLIAHIVAAYHQRLRAWLPELEALASKVVRAHGSQHAELESLRLQLESLATELRSHMEKEEYILFPYIEQLAQLTPGQAGHARPSFGSLRHPLSVMLREHADAGEALAAMRRLSGDYVMPGDACPSWRRFYSSLAELEAELHAHIHLENQILFPRAEELEKAVEDA